MNYLPPARESGLQGCLKTIATIVGILTGLIVIVQFLVEFFYQDDPSSFLQSISSILDSSLPRVSSFLSNIDNARIQYIDSHPASVWISAIGICLVIGVASFLIEEEFIPDTPISTFFILLPLALVWLWVFSGFVNTFGIILFIIGALISFLAGFFLVSY